MAEKKLKITLVKSPIGAVPKNKKTVEALGLRKLNKTVEMPDNEAVRGMIRQVRHLVKVEEIYQTYSRQKAQSTVIISEEDVDTVQAMARPLVRVIRDRRLVQELQDLVLKVVRCLYTDVFLREVSHAETLRKSLVSTYLILRDLKMVQL